MGILRIHGSLEHWKMVGNQGSSGKPERETLRNSHLVKSMIRHPVGLSWDTPLWEGSLSHNLTTQPHLSEGVVSSPGAQRMQNSCLVENKQKMCIITIYQGPTICQALC